MTNGIDKTQIPLVLVGNKCDLNEDRQVPREVGVALSGRVTSPPMRILLILLS